MSVLYFFAMFVMFFPTLAPHASAGEGIGTAQAPSAHPAQYDRAGQVTGVVEVV